METGDGIIEAGTPPTLWAFILSTARKTENNSYVEQQVNKHTVYNATSHDEIDHPNNKGMPV